MVNDWWWIIYGAWLMVNNWRCFVYGESLYGEYRMNCRSHFFFCVEPIRQRLRRQKRQACEKLKCHQGHGGEIHVLFKPQVELFRSGLGTEIGWRHVSNEKTLLVLAYTQHWAMKKDPWLFGFHDNIRGEILPFVMGFTTSFFWNPYWTTSIMEGFFRRFQTCELLRLRFILQERERWRA